jgi:hypothetical protein
MEIMKPQRAIVTDQFISIFSLITGTFVKANTNNINLKRKCTARIMKKKLVTFVSYHRDSSNVFKLWDCSAEIFYNCEPQSGQTEKSMNTNII